MPKLLIVTTVAVTLRAFLLPYKEGLFEVYCHMVAGKTKFHLSKPKFHPKLSSE
ncbi:hypothetical protein FACS1894204_08180 [Synergistales bacterium]|nr:hypothetical protein FACS1894204_08180 [Synergistales bacterium]